MAAAVGLGAVALRAIAQPLLHDNLPFLIAFPATVLSGLFWGSGPGLLTAALCAIAAALPGVPPEVPTIAQPVQIGGFMLGAIMIALLCGQLRTAPSAAAPADTGTPADTPLTRWLRAALWGAFLIPMTLFVVIAWWGYQRAQQEALATAASASELAYRHAQRTIDIAADIARRVDAVTAGTDDEVRAQEAALHQRLTDLIAGLPSVLNLNVWDAEGHPLVGSDTTPVNRAVSVADREYFRAQRSAGAPIDVSALVTGRQSGRQLTNVVLRRAAPDGEFRGVVAVSMTPSYFSDYYRSLAREAPGVARFALVRTDGKTIAHWTGPAAATERTDDDPALAPALQRIGAGQRDGSFTVAAPPGGDATIAGFKRLDGYPAVVVVGFSHEQMLAGWTRFVALLLAVLLPTTVGLVCVSWVALKRTRREQAIAHELQAETQRRAAVERTMLESQKFETLALLTGGVAHDFNNLLAVVNTSLHVLNRLHPALAETKQMQSIGRAVQTGVRLTRQLLSFSRKQALLPEVVDLRAWLPSTEELAQSTLRGGVSWALELSPQPLPVEVDLGELELALINLVVNANLAMPDGGRVTVAAHPTPADDPAAPAFVTLSVQDTGVGIPADLLPRVCEPFFTTRDRGAGSGLGLSQVQGFCARAGGRLRIDSTVGVGTTVRMELPRAASAPPAEPDASPVEASERFQGRVLLVEDNEDVAQTMETMLRAAGLDVVCAANAVAALAVLDDRSLPPPDAVLSDIEMPGRVNGITLAFALRSRRPDLPVILVTGYADQIDEAAAGGLRVLAKPVEPTQLLAELRASIERARARRRAEEETT